MMDNDKIQSFIDMVDEVLLEPNNFNKNWVELLEFCKTLLRKELKIVPEPIIFGDIYKCPACGLCGIEHDKYADYCERCGQAFEWEE